VVMAWGTTEISPEKPQQVAAEKHTPHTASSGRAMEAVSAPSYDPKGLCETVTWRSAIAGS
jgi:hypothetical protein